MIGWVLLGYLMVANVVGFIAMGWDKQKAKKNQWRILECRLLLFALVGGSVGSFLGMRVYRHKTKHLKFVLGIPAIFILQIVLVVVSQMYFKWM